MVDSTGSKSQVLKQISFESAQSPPFQLLPFDCFSSVIQIRIHDQGKCSVLVLYFKRGIHNKKNHFEHFSKTDLRTGRFLHGGADFFFRIAMTFLWRWQPDIWSPETKIW